MSTPTWPAYYLGETENFRALGVISANFNSLEWRLRTFFITYLNAPTEAVIRIFANLDNGTRMSILRLALEAAIQPEFVKGGIGNFISAFSTCNENRNILMHSKTYMNTELDVGLGFMKSPQKDPMTANYYEPSLPLLRQIADEMHEAERYGSLVLQYIFNHYTPAWLKDLERDEQFPWPDKFVQPTPLAPIPN